jgi:hypothetical protein
MVSQTWGLRGVRQSRRLNQPGNRFEDKFRRNRLCTMRTGDFGELHVVYMCGLLIELKSP